MNEIATINRQANNACFMSLASLREAHSKLLSFHREQEYNDETIFKIEDFISRGCATGRLLDNEDDRWNAQSLLDYWGSILYRAGRQSPDTTLAEFDISLSPVLRDDQCPYLGLEAFREEHHSLFFGRQRLITKLLEHLKQHRLLIVLGSSGSGKSSIVMGGLLPRVKSGDLPDSYSWRYIPTFVPGTDPLKSLCDCLFSSSTISPEKIQQQIALMKKDSNHLLSLLGDIPTTIVVDQFEEVFTLCTDGESRNAFINNLLSIVQDSIISHHLILTMRSDFESQIAKFSGLERVFENSVSRVLAMGAHELRSAIEEPAVRVGLKLEDGLIENLVSDFLGEPAALPLLQFTLLKLWEMRVHNRITNESYRMLGRGRQSLSNSANQFFSKLIPEEQKSAKRILLSMVRPTAGLEVTSNRILRQDIYRAGEANDRVDRVLDKLIQARLVRQSVGQNQNDTQIEIAHEALIRNWDLLEGWLDNERGRLRQRLHLKSLAEQWQMRGRDRAVLLQGDLLQEVQQYDDLSSIELEFIKYSQKKKKKRFLILGGLSTSVGALLFALIVGYLIHKHETDTSVLTQRNQKLQQEKSDLEQEKQVLKDQYQALKDKQDESRPIEDPPSTSSNTGHSFPSYNQPGNTSVEKEPTPKPSIETQGGNKREKAGVSNSKVNPPNVPLPDPQNSSSSDPPPPSPETSPENPNKMNSQVPISPAVTPKNKLKENSSSNSSDNDQQKSERTTSSNTVLQDTPSSEKSNSDVN
jgi:hypothetical protein